VCANTNKWTTTQTMTVNTIVIQFVVLSFSQVEIKLLTQPV